MSTISSDGDQEGTPIAIVGRNAGSVILDVIEEDADHVLMGWRGSRAQREHILGSTIDPVTGRAPCDATLVNLGPHGTYGEEEVLVLFGEGPHAPVAARRAGELAAAAEGERSLTLYNVQQPLDGEAGEEPVPRERGEAIVEKVIEQAGLEYMTYETRIEEADDIEEAVLGITDEYDTVCVGATRTGVVSQALFGSLPETVGEKVDGTVLMARGPDNSPTSIREANVRRLDV